MAHNFTAHVIIGDSLLCTKCTQCGCRDDSDRALSACIFSPQPDLSRIIDERVEKRLKLDPRINTPGKAGAVFLLFYHGKPVGTAFAIDEQHLMTARHNLYDPLVVIRQGDLAEIQIVTLPSSSSSSTLNSQVNIDMIEIEVLAGGNNDSFDQEDWLILRRKDSVKFRNIILIRVTDVNQIKQNVPFITIYHYSVNLLTTEKLEPTLYHSQNRVVNAQNGLLICQDKVVVTGGSCGAPFVEDDTGAALGFHIYGSSAAKTVSKALEDVIQDIPYGLHFQQGSSVVNALHLHQILKP